MDQLIFASLSHTRYRYEVGMLKVPAGIYIVYNSQHSAESKEQPGMVPNPARGRR